MIIYEKRVSTVMLINYSNINKTDNHLSLILTEYTEHRQRPRHMTLETRSWLWTSTQKTQTHWYINKNGRNILDYWV